VIEDVTMKQSRFLNYFCVFVCERNEKEGTSF